MNVKQNLWRLARTLVGLGVGALVSSFVGVGLIGGTALEDPEGGPNYWGTALTATLFVLLFALPVGLTGHAVLYALKRRALVYYAGVAAAAGIAFELAGYLLDRHTDVLFALKNGLIFAVWAGVCAAIAWFIRRPDKDEVRLPDPASHF